MVENMWGYSGVLVNMQAVLAYLELDVFNSQKRACSSVLTFGHVVIYSTRGPCIGCRESARLLLRWPLHLVSLTVWALSVIYSFHFIGYLFSETTVFFCFIAVCGTEMRSSSEAYFQ